MEPYRSRARSTTTSTGVAVPPSVYISQPEDDGPDPTADAQPPRPVPASPARGVQFQSLGSRQPSIRLRRVRPISPSRLAPAVSNEQPPPRADDNVETTGSRRRSMSDPQGRRRGDDSNPQATALKPLPPLPEGARGSSMYDTHLDVPDPARLAPGPPERPAEHRLRRVSNAVFDGIGRRRSTTQDQAQVPAAPDELYDSRVVDFLDVVDPEVATLSTVTNVQNSLFVPSLGRWLDRRPTYDLSDLPAIPGAFPQSETDLATSDGTDQGLPSERDRIVRLSSILATPQYAVLPEDVSLEGWSEEDIKLVDDYVRHMLHSRRSKFKQSLRAFGKYVRRPLGLFVTVYATLITLFGLAWVLFLIGWIYVGDKQLYVINVIDNVLVALFAVVGDGLAPFRAVDTYHMIFIAHYHRKTWKLRKKLLLPKLPDHNDLPIDDTPATNVADLEAARAIRDPSANPSDLPVLPPKEQARLVYHQAKLAKSHTFYKPHETETHHAFPLKLLIVIVSLLDLHSCLQISLGATTWSIDYHVRPTALTTTILCCSITANITAGVLITIGDRRTRKKDILERMMKQDLTRHAMRHVEKQHKKESEKAARASEDGEALKDRLQRSLNNLGRRSEDHPRSSLNNLTRKSEDHPRSSSEDYRKSLDQVGRFDTKVYPMSPASSSRTGLREFRTPQDF